MDLVQDLISLLLVCVCVCVCVGGVEYQQVYSRSKFQVHQIAGRPGRAEEAYMGAWVNEGDPPPRADRVDPKSAPGFFGLGRFFYFS